MQKIGWKTCMKPPESYAFTDTMRGVHPCSSQHIWWTYLLPYHRSSLITKKQVNDNSKTSARIHTYTFAQNPHGTAQTEWNCLSRRWDIVKVSPPEQTTYNTARQRNTHCFQERLPTPLLPQLCLGFHSKRGSQNNDPDSKLRALKWPSSM